VRGVRFASGRRRRRAGDERLRLQGNMIQLYGCWGYDRELPLGSSLAIHVSMFDYTANCGV